MILREPATPEQLSELASSLTRTHFECETLSDLLTTMYGVEDQRAVRAQELHNHFSVYCGRLSAATQNNRLGLRGNSYWAGARIWERQFFRFRRFSLARTVGTGTNSQDRPSDRTISTSSPSGAFSNCSARCSSAYGKSYAAISRPKRRLCLLWPRSLSQTHLHPATPARSEVLLFS